MRLNKVKYLARNIRVVANVASFNFPVVQLFHLSILGRNDANRDLCRLTQIWTIVGNRRYRPSSQPLSGLLAQAFERPIFQHFGPSETAYFTIGPLDSRECREYKLVNCRRRAMRHSDPPLRVPAWLTEGILQSLISGEGTPALTPQKSTPPDLPVRHVCGRRRTIRGRCRHGCATCPQQWSGVRKIQRRRPGLLADR